MDNYKKLVGKFCSECLEDIDDHAKDGEVWAEMGGMITGNATCPDCGLTNYVEAPVFVIDRMREAERSLDSLRLLRKVERSFENLILSQAGG